jgi:predicted RecA/RadA family phage recombinase
MAASAAFVQTGDRQPYSNTGSAIVSKDVVTRVSGNSGCIGIAVADIAATTGTGVLDVVGVWTLPKATGEAFTDGQRLYWTGTALTGASTGNTNAGRAVGAAASAATTANISLNQP